jgi:hypothetical protein
MAWAVDKVVPVPIFDDQIPTRHGGESPSPNGRRRVAIYNLYWGTLGGGEVVSGAFARALTSNFDVTLLGPEPPDVEMFMQRLGIDLSRCEWKKVDSDHEASQISRGFDIFVNCTYLSSAVNMSPVGLYYVHFPGGVSKSMPQAVIYAGISLAKVLSYVPLFSRKAGRLRELLQGKTINTSWTNSYSKFLANSAYTQKWIRNIWGQQSDVVYPPVTTSVGPGDKQMTIASIGRFFDPRFGHSKKQLELVAAFSSMVNSGVNSPPKPQRLRLCIHWVLRVSMPRSR